MTTTNETTRRLLDSDTAEYLGRATPEQIAASDDAGPEGHILVDEAGHVVPERRPGVRRVYVERE